MLKACVSDYIEPRTALERQLTEMWADLLGIDRVGITDNFFKLGGHSLLLVQLGSRIYDSFALELPLYVLFEASTIELLSKAILKAQIEDVDPDELMSLIEGVRQDTA